MKRIHALDVLGEVRRAQRILKRVAQYLTQAERAKARADERRAEADELTRIARIGRGES